MTDDFYSENDSSTNQLRFYRLAKQRFGLSKKLFDVIGASIGGLALLPLLILISLAVKTTSKGPILFRQKRHGLNGELFYAYKFRSMYTDRGDRSGIQQTVKDDPRVTLVGKFLRRSNFDELPQLINVLKGEMSLVGPRPHVPGMLANGVTYEEFDSRYQLRHRVKPGITGLAQVKGFRGETKDAFAAASRLHYDLEYIEHQTLMLDIKIILGTVKNEFFGGNGY